MHALAVDTTVSNLAQPQEKVWRVTYDDVVAVVNC